MQNNKDVINLYTMSTCPKCKILHNLCLNNERLKNSDFKEFEIDINDESDTNLQLLKEHNIVNLPVLLVNNTFMNFNEAVEYVRNY